jgi:RNA polymerase sigma-70 factor (ECF subfamily)
VDDEQLLAQWRAGDRRAGDHLFERHGSALIRFFRGMVRDAAEELVQDTFMRAVEGRDRIHSDFRAYLFGIAWNVLRGHFRKLARDREVDLEVESMENLDPGPSTLVARRREQRLLHEALRRLPAQHQAALQLHYWDGLRTQEIADIMGISASGMRTRMQTARALLEAQIAELDRTMPLAVSTETESSDE